MKRLVVFFMISFLAITSIAAQQREPRQRTTPEERAKRQTEVLAKELNLTKEQKEKIYEINLKFSQPVKKQDKPQGKEVDRQKQREDFVKLYQERTDSIKSILTEDQKTKFDEHQKKMRKAPRGEKNRRK